MISRYVYFGTYLEIIGGEIKRNESVKGCSACRTTDVEKFCHRCGSPIQKYDRPKVYQNAFQFFCVAEDEGNIEESFHNIFTTSGENCVIPNRKTDIGDGQFLDDTFHADMPAFDEEKALDFYKPVIDVLTHYWIGYRLRYGVCCEVS